MSHLPLLVFVVVLFAAMLHAGWNALVKSSSEKFLTAILIAASAAVIAAALLPFLGRVAPASLPYAAVSAVFQIIYFILLARTYHLAEMSQTYPLMRGAAPLLVALTSAYGFGESLSAMAWLGVVAVSGGILTIAAGHRIDHRKGIGLAALNAVVIACYTMIDGRGVRISGAPAPYTLWVVLLTGLPLTLWCVLRRRVTFVPYLRRYWRWGLAGGVATTVSYGLALWAMTRAPIAVIAALRETSILFGILIAGVVLKEQVGPKRFISACVIAGGAVALRLS